MRFAHVLLFLALVSCRNFITIAPKPVVAHSISPSGNNFNGGVIDCDSSGCVVTSSWLDHYRKLEKANKNYIGADKNIKQEGVNWRVSYEVVNHFLVLRQAERGA